MAKKSPKGKGTGIAAEDESKEKGGSKLAMIVVTLLLILIWVVIFGVLIKLDLGGFGSRILSPLLKDIPVVNKILPVSTKTTENTEGGTYKTLAEALKRIQELESQLNSQDTNNQGDATEVAKLKKEVERLKVFEDDQLSFEEEKTKFYNEVVYNDKAPDLKEYQAWYESIEPAKAAELYRQVAEKNALSDQVKDYAAAYSSMKPQEAAQILQTMTGDLDLVSDILSGMSADQRGAVLGKMDPNIAAKITKKMYPEE